MAAQTKKEYMKDSSTRKALLIATGCEIQLEPRMVSQMRMAQTKLRALKI